MPDADKLDVNAVQCLGVFGYCVEDVIFDLIQFHFFRVDVDQGIEVNRAEDATAVGAKQRGELVGQLLARPSHVGNCRVWASSFPCRALF